MVNFGIILCNSVQVDLWQIDYSQLVYYIGEAFLHARILVCLPLAQSAPNVSFTGHPEPLLKLVVLHQQVKFVRCGHQHDLNCQVQDEICVTCWHKICDFTLC